jgi:hypothetical protein
MEIEQKKLQLFRVSFIFATLSTGEINLYNRQTILSDVVNLGSTFAASCSSLYDSKSS